MESRQWLLLVLAAFALGFVLLAFATADFSSFGKGLSAPGSKSEAQCIGLIRIEGTIDSESRSSLFDASSLPEEMARAIKDANEDDSIGSVLLVVNSPGGSAVASKEIYDSIAESQKPVVVYLSEVAASGGYYVASAGDYIVANPNTITGSIGARATVVNYEELFNKLGLRTDTIKSGDLKDIGGGDHNMTVLERQVLESVIAETFSNFKADVQQGRKGKLDLNKFETALDARILTAKQAKSIGLIDEIGSRNVALKKAAELGGVKTGADGLPESCELVEKSGLSSLLSELSLSISRGVKAGLSEQKVSLRFEQ